MSKTSIKNVFNPEDQLCAVQIAAVSGLLLHKSLQSLHQNSRNSQTGMAAKHRTRGLKVE